jgi:photosystem I P700 chlorophyll a apoprotein A1
LWPNVGHYSSSLAKSSKTTTWLWNFYIIIYDFESQISKPNLTSKIFTSNLDYIILTSIWLGGTYFYKIHYSNYSTWLISPKNILSSVYLIWFIINQNIFNMDLGSYYSGKVISSGLFHLWMSEGILCQHHLKLASIIHLILSSILLIGGFIHFYINSKIIKIFSKIKLTSIHYIPIFLDLSLLSWSGHLIHIAIPIFVFLVFKISNNLIPYPYDLLFILILTKIFLGFILSFLTNFKTSLPYSDSSLLNLNIDPITNYINLAFIISYHYYLAISLLIRNLIVSFININKPKILIIFSFILISSNLQLIISLIIFSINFTLFAHHSYIVPVYLFMSNDYTTLFSLFCYHINIGSILILGSGTYISIYLVRDYYKI